MILPRHLLPVVSVLIACGSGVQAQVGHSLHFSARQCNEDAIVVHVNAAAFPQLLGSAFTPVLEEGKARVLIVAHDCSQYFMDGEDVGPTQETQVWLAIAGPADMRPVVGSERTLPTRTWFNLFSGSNNPRVRDIKAESGLQQQPIRGIALDAPGPRRGGRLSLPGDLEYSWRVVSAPAPARLIGINHDVYTRDSTGNVAMNQIQVVVHLSAGASPGSLTVTGHTDPLPWLPPGTYPVTVQTFFPIWSRATLGLQPPGAPWTK